MLLLRVSALLVPSITSPSLVHRRKTTGRQQVQGMLILSSGSLYSTCAVKLLLILVVGLHNVAVLKRLLQCLHSRSLVKLNLRLPLALVVDEGRGWKKVCLCRRLRELHGKLVGP